MTRYSYRISDYYAILISADASFCREFLDYCTERYGPRNRQGFAKVFVSQNFDEALSLFHIENDRYAVVIDNNLETGDVLSFFDQIHDKLTQQLLKYHTDPKEIKIHQRIFERECFFVLLEDVIQPLPRYVNLEERSHVWYLQKPVTLEEIDEIISPAKMRVEAQWLRDPQTRMPSGQAIQIKMQEMGKNIDQISVFIHVLGFSETGKNYRFNDGELNEIVFFMTDVVEQVVEEYEGSNGWIGQLGGFHFFIVVHPDHLQSVIQKIETLFRDGMRAFYSSEMIDQLSILFHSQYKLT